jgi:hypothetical protein
MGMFEDPTVATAEHLKLPWSGDKENFRCRICGHKFKVGDVFRQVFTNCSPNYPSNPIVCQSCDGPDVIERWNQHAAGWAEIEHKYWYFVNQVVTRRQQQGANRRGR